MTTQTFTDSRLAILYSPEWLYDALMEIIEPELMIGNVREADEKHKEETAQERARRYAHYEECFGTYDDCLKDLEEFWTEGAAEIKKAVQDHATKETKQSESKIMQGIETSLDNSDL